MVNVGKACTLIRDYKSIILDRDRELRWFLCKNGVLRDFLGSEREGPTFNIESVLRGAV